MLQDPTIRIVVSCHKPFACPKSEIYLPVHVGAADADRPLEGAVPDNKGQNISSRNFTFCELTAQYWAWKNLRADYVGQCHYRRYFVFDGKRRVANDHGQIEAPLLDDDAIRAFRLEDDALSRTAIAGADAIVPRSWDVRFTRTPAGVKRTVRDHMVGYGLVSHGTLDRLEELVNSISPAYAPFVTNYLNSPNYLGYNCFVLGRPLFDELCAFEFPILLEFDRTFVYEGIPTIQKRVCGFLGEVLFSAFVMKLEFDGVHSVKHVPLVFFERTDSFDLMDSRQCGPDRSSIGEIILPKGSVRRLWVGKVLNRLQCDR